MISATFGRARVSGIIGGFLGMAMAGAPNAFAIDVTAATFFAACPGPIYVAADTSISGKAEIDGDCTVSVDPGYDVALTKAKLSFTGQFYILGNAGDLAITKSKIAADGGGGIVLDSTGDVSITGSKIEASGGSINIPPREDVVIEKSDLTALGEVILAGMGGLRSVTDSHLTGGTLRFQAGEHSLLGTLTTTVITGSSLLSLGTIIVGGQGPHSISGSQLEAQGFGVLFEPGVSNGGTREIVDSTLTAPNGIMNFGGSGEVLVEDTTVNSLSNISFYQGNGSATLRRAKFQSEEGQISFTGAQNAIIEDSKIDAANILFTNSNLVDVDGSSLRARSGAISASVSGLVSFDDSKLGADGDVQYALNISNGNGRSFTGTKIKLPLGGISLIGASLTSLTDTKISSKNDRGMRVEGNQFGSTDSKITTLGQVRILMGSNGNVTTSKLKFGTEFVMETGFSGSSTVADSDFKGADLAVRSYNTTTATDNDFVIADTIELSATTSCVSTGNNPDIACN